MEFKIPDNCGNSPRMMIVAELCRAWGEGDQDYLDAWLAEDAVWTTHPEVGSADIASLELENVVTHGRVGSCDGIAVRADGSHLHFAHFFRFASTAKTAKVRAITSYLVSMQEED
jgi:hypothetical protein